MNLKNKIRNYGFWMSIIGAAVMIMQALGLNINIPMINEALTSVCGLLVVLGIISNPEKGKGYIDSEDKEDKE